MDKFRNLLDILKSQCELYSELASVMALEKEAVSRWNVDDTLELTKRKDTLVYKEKLLEEARRTIIKKISMDEGRDEISLSEIIDLTNEAELRQEFSQVRNNLKNVMHRLNDENLALKILYRTNISLVNDFFDKLGITAGSTYSTHGKPRGINSLVDRRG
ncbi:flagella synthesis protein FlgN [Geovibrio ferrireducens]|uniref:flagella synthesis protein FlgN n=1 Tax=Geovibrio ferrireducens TaxID=46201 RepID=UPI0022453893|nr:flagellar protein FlgN [Geovibrio ferrireducens]